MFDVGKFAFRKPIAENVNNVVLYRIFYMSTKEQVRKRHGKIELAEQWLKVLSSSPHVAQSGPFAFNTPILLDRTIRLQLMHACVCVCARVRQVSRATWRQSLV